MLLSTYTAQILNVDVEERENEIQAGGQMTHAITSLCTCVALADQQQCQDLQTTTSTRITQL